MSAEWYQHIRLGQGQTLTPAHTAAYQSMHPALMSCFNAWRANQDEANWDIAVQSKCYLFYARFTGENSKRFRPLHMPKRLPFEDNRWRVGWKHTKNDSAGPWLLDPLHDLAVALIELLQVGDLSDILEIDLKVPEAPSPPSHLARKKKKKAAGNLKKSTDQRMTVSYNLGPSNRGTSSEDYYASFERSQDRSGIGYGSSHTGTYSNGGYGGYGGYDSDPYSGADWTACDKECGWCGRCIESVTWE